MLPKTLSILKISFVTAVVGTYGGAAREAPMHLKETSNGSFKPFDHSPLIESLTSKEIYDPADKYESI